MSFLDRQVSRARSRLTLDVLCQRSCLGLLVAAGLWGLTIIVVRLFALDVPLWQGGWMAALLALLVGVVGMAMARPTAVQAAVALDAAAGLKERLSTALVMRQQNDPFVRATVTDAEQTAARIHVPTHIRYRSPELLPWSTAAVVAALILAWFMPTIDLLAEEPAAAQQVPRAEVESEHQAIKVELEKKLSKIKELARDNPELKDLVDDIEPLEMPDQPTITPDDVRREAAQKIDNIRDKLKEKLEAAEDDGLKSTKRMFQQLNEPGNKPANDKLAQSLAGGDFAGAKQALDELAADIEDAAKNAEDPEAKQRLAEMQQQLERLADQLSKLSDTVKLQKELENKAGLSAEEAKKLLDQLKKMDPQQLQKELQKRLGDKGVSQQQIQELAKKMQQQQKAQKSCQNMSQALSKAAQACQKCQSPGSSGSGASQASNALSDAASQLSDLEMSEQLLNELEAQISDFDSMRESVCKGGMCPGGQGNRPGGIGQQGPNAGLGLGERVGKERVAYSRKPTKVTSRFQSGTVIGRMLVEGPQVRGEATAEEYAAAQSEVRDALDDVEREDVPRQYHKSLRAYFERLAGLMREQQAAGTEPAVPEESEESEDPPQP